MEKENKSVATRKTKKKELVIHKKPRQEKIDLQGIVLGMIGVAGIMAVALAAPNAFQMVRVFRNFDDAKTKSRYKYSVNAAICRLQKKGLLSVEQRSGRPYYRLTEKGALELVRYKMKEKSIKRRRWDGKWRIVIFDVKEDNRSVRDHLRRMLSEFGFIRLQDSVWVSPYECEEVVQLLKAKCRIGKDALYITAENIEQDSFLREHFDLK
jgi:CRISPR-associated endonuclease Cas2